MRRYFIKFSYLGTQYRGLQKNVISNENLLMHDTDTVQGALECAFSTLNPRYTKWPKITTSSRTDVGVHALCNTAHVDIENKDDSIYNPPVAIAFVNRYLMQSNHNIRLLEFIPVKNTFHTRQFVKFRTYIYRFLKAKNIDEHRVPVAELTQCFHFRSKSFDLEKLRQGTKLFVGTKNFTTFSEKSISDKPIRYVKTLYSFELEKGCPLMPYDALSQNFDYWNIVCTGRSFLYKQVRRMVGALFALSNNTITEKDINVMLQVPNHKNWYPQVVTVPALGLYLANVEYCQEEIDKHIIKYNASPEDLVVTPIDSN
ncbi:tRNA pseudouridine synthase-like 1 [Xylocopa sonorina]|uniref:tRNA pseudouridine synthase-like 1 n=1 Tax=Xylocopa sonorina TaxID=1818115 RepID=UPI00403B1940